MEYIQLAPSLQLPTCNPTSQQKCIYDFYESRHSADADDIYSSEWYHRTVEFTRQTSRQSKAFPTRLNSWERIEELEFGPLFLSHPIAAYSFWQMLNAFYAFDKTVCGTSENSLCKVDEWKQMKPFLYLKERKIRNAWRRSLNVMKKEIECGILEGEALLLKLHDLLVGVSGLENAFAALEESFEENLKDMIFVDTMLAKTAEAVESRRSMIANLLRLERNNPSFGKDGGDSSFHTFGE
jgi:hypothetical protein